jgi:uncharacterized protein involved in tolerance to divalent cations
MSKNNLTLKDYSIEFVTNSASATLQLIPYLGGALNQMTFGYLSSLQMKRIENYLVKVSEYLQFGAMQKEALDQIGDYLNSEDGKEFFYLNLEKVAKTRNEEKLKVFRNMFLNQSSGHKTFSLDTAEDFLNILESIRFESVKVLEFLNSYEEPNTKVEYEDENGMLIAPKKQEESEYITSLKKVHPYEIDELNYFHQQLVTNGLAIDNSPTSIGINILEQPKITKMGELFLDYILEKNI